MCVLNINYVYKYTLITWQKSAGPDNLDPYFLKLAANFIAVPFN